MSISSTSASNVVSGFAASVERIQVHDDDIDEAETVTGERGQIVGTVAAGENAAMNGWMQRLHAAVHHFRETR